MAASIKTGSRGFTLMELMIVMMILLVLAGLSTPVVHYGISRSRESALRETLMVTRKAIDDYYADQMKYPDTLATLQTARYLRIPPYDPFTSSTDTWVLAQDDKGGITDLHSSADNEALDGSLVNTW